MADARYALVVIAFILPLGWLDAALILPVTFEGHIAMNPIAYRLLPIADAAW